MAPSGRVVISINHISEFIVVFIILDPSDKQLFRDWTIIYGDMIGY